MDGSQRRCASASELGYLAPAVAAGCRIVFSEGDGLSGLVVDRYGDWLAVQLTSLALFRRLTPTLDGLLSPQGIVLRTEKGMLNEEGLEASDGILRGVAPQGPVSIEENGIRYLVDLLAGQKTGFFLDQRENRANVATYASVRRVADLFCYSGGFTLPLVRGDASPSWRVELRPPTTPSPPPVQRPSTSSASSAGSSERFERLGTNAARSPAVTRRTSRTNLFSDLPIPLPRKG